MHSATVRPTLLLGLMLSCGLTLAAPAKAPPPELPAETLAPSTLAGTSAARVYVATSYLARGSRGERSDVLEVHDTQNLGFKYEVTLPPNRAQALNYRGLVSITGNGQFVLVMNATPGTSVTVVNLQTRKVVSEVQTPGCWGSMPAAEGARFSMLCGDGKVATITLNEQGQVAERQLSDKLFDADQDAWFHHAERVGDRYWFMSFQGQVTELNLGGPVAQRVSQLSLVRGKDKKSGWRVVDNSGLKPLVSLVRVGEAALHLESND